MPRKIPRTPTRQRHKELNIEQSTTKGFNIQEALAILGGITGIILAVFWVAGRIYTAGFFGAMNIPAFQINFSVWEYAEVAWLKLIFYFWKKYIQFCCFLPLFLLA